MKNVADHIKEDGSGAFTLSAKDTELLLEDLAPKPKSRKKKLPKIIRPEEVDRLMNAIPVPGPQDVRDRAILELMYRAGLRVSEAVGVHRRDLDLEEGTVRLFDAKGGDGTAYFDTARVGPIVRAWLYERAAWVDGPGRESPLVFVSRLGKPVTTRYVQRMVKHRAELAGITSRCTPHVLRHTYATELLRDGFSLREVQVALRHANVGTTEVYTHVLDEELRRKMNTRPTTRGERDS